MSNYKFTVGEYKTRGGDTAVVRWDKSEDLPDCEDNYLLIGFAVRGSGSKDEINWTKGGLYYEDGEDSDDLMPPAPKRKKVPLEDGDIDIGYQIRMIGHKTRNLVTGVEEGSFSIPMGSFFLRHLFLNQQYEYRVDKNSPWQPFHKEIEDHD